MSAIGKQLLAITTLIIFLSLNPIFAQVHEISFVATDCLSDFQDEYSSREIIKAWSRGESEELYLLELPKNSQLRATIRAIGDVYINFVSSDTTRYMKEIRPLIVKDSSGDFYSSLPGVVREHEYLGIKNHYYMYFTISVDAFVSYCRGIGIICDLANQTFGTEMKRYKFQQRATDLVYHNFYEDFASWCLETKFTGEYLYDYALKIGEAHPYESDGYSVIPVTVVLKQNKNTSQFFKMFIDVMNAMRIPDSLAQAMKSKNYKTYHIKMFTLPPYDWQMRFRERALKESRYDSPNLTPHFIIGYDLERIDDQFNYTEMIRTDNNGLKKVDGQFYLPLNTIAFNSIFERIHYQFHIYDNISGKDGFSYLVTDEMNLIPPKVYEQYGKQFDDDYETYCYMSDLGYTSCVYNMEQGNVVILAKTDFGEFVTESIPFDIVMGNEDLMKLTSLEVNNAPDMIDGRIPYGNLKSENLDPYDGWAYTCNYYYSEACSWNTWNTKYVLGFANNESRRKITYMPKPDYSNMRGTYIAVPGSGITYTNETIYINDGQWVAKGGDNMSGFEYKGTISEDGRLIIAEGLYSYFDGIGVATEKATVGEEYGKFKYKTIVSYGSVYDGLFIRK